MALCHLRIFMATLERNTKQIAEELVWLEIPLCVFNIIVNGYSRPHLDVDGG